MYDIPVRIEYVQYQQLKQACRISQGCTINYRQCSEKDTIYISGPKKRKTYNKKIRFIFRSKNPEKLRLFDTVRLLGFCWYFWEERGLCTFRGVGWS